MPATGRYKLKAISMKTIRVCTGRSCRDRGATTLIETIATHYRTKPGADNGQVDLNICDCLGYCEQAPSVLVDDTLLITEASPTRIISDIEANKGRDIRNMSLEELTKDELFDDFI